MSFRTVADDIVRERFRDAVGAWMCGSVATGQVSPTSDLDLVVVVRDATPSRETFRWTDMLVEQFVHTEQSLPDWYARDASEYRCTLANMVATGVPLIESSAAADLQSTAQAHVQQGPPPCDQAEIDAQRYHLSSAVDDLVGTDDRDELVFIAAGAVEQVSQLELAICGSWTGRGKWLHRWLTVAAPTTAAPLVAAMQVVSQDRQPLVKIAREVLDRAGGWLQEGYRLD